MHPLRADRAGFPEYAGQYRLESVLGSGGMGVVHLATSDSGLRLAVKVVHAEHAVDPEFRARFRQEVAAARRVSGAFTAPVVDADPDAERPWMATLFIDAPTLADRVREKPLDGAEAARLGAGLAEALRDIHRVGVVHRDLKPSNVLMASDGVRVIDFGISRPADSDLRTETGKLIGTPPFMAPEQFQRPREVGPAADVFAMGAVLVHAVTGRGPFDSDSHYLVAYQVVHNEPDLGGVPPSLAPIVARCLAKDPADRPTPDALLLELRAAAYPTGEETRAFIPQPRRPLAGESRPAAEQDTHRRSRGTERPAPVPGPRRWRAAALLATGLLLTGGAVGGYLHFREGPGPVQPASAPVRAPRGAPVTTWVSALAGPEREVKVVPCAWADGALYCSAPGVAAARLNPVDGSVAWSVPAQAPGSDSRPPLSAGGLVLTVTAGGQTLRALDPATGAQRWQKQVPTGVQIVSAGGTVLMADRNGKATALDPATGGPGWTRQIGGVGSFWLTDAQGPEGCSLYVVTPAGDGRSSEVTAADCASGTVRWRQRVPGTAEPVGVARGSLHLLRSDIEERARGVIRIDLGTRSVTETPLAAGLLQAQAAVDAAGVVYVVATSGTLAAVGETGETWRLETGVAVSSRPVSGEGRLYLTGMDGRLLAVDPSAGRLAGQTKARMGTGLAHTVTVPAPVVADGRVFGSAPDGSVFAVDAANPAGW